MDELVQQLGSAVSNLSSCVPASEGWSGRAATALAQEIHEIAREIGGLILDLVSGNHFSAIEELGLG
jgi:hypothetical protein